MDKELKTSYVCRTQKDYNMSFKLSVVREIECGEFSLKAAREKYGIQGDHTVEKWIKKYGTFDRELQVQLTMQKVLNKNFWNQRPKSGCLKSKSKAWKNNLNSSKTKSSCLI